MKSLVMLMVCMTFLVQCHLYAEEQDDAWISFIDEIAKYRNEDTNHIYYAGSSNDIAFLYHRTSKGIREWQINKIHLLDTVRRPFSHDNKRWIIIKTDTDEKISCRRNLRSLRLLMSFSYHQETVIIRTGPQCSYVGVNIK